MQGMTIFDSDILGADTTQVESLSKALLDGNVPGTNESGLSSLSDTALWNADPWNVWLIVACTISGMIASMVPAIRTASLIRSVDVTLDAQVVYVFS